MYIAISGNIGSGKSSLSALLAARYGFRPILEPASENPYLADFYRDMGAYAFHSQVFFLAKRLEQHLGEVNLASRIVQDRTVFEDANIFARALAESGHLSRRDWLTYQSLYRGIVPALRRPDLLVYIQASLPTLRRRIRRRGREFEQDIPDAYLIQLNELYRDFIELCGRDGELGSVLIIDGDACDFVASEEDFESICRLLEPFGLERALEFTEGERERIISEVVRSELQGELRGEG